MDNDCDGDTDEGCECIDGQVQPCGTTDVGACAFGIQTCVGGAWGVCIGAVEPQPEVCDGIDNNCDGSTDEGC